MLTLTCYCWLLAEAKDNNTPSRPSRVHYYEEMPNPYPPPFTKPPFGSFRMLQSVLCTWCKWPRLVHPFDCRCLKKHSSRASICPAILLSAPWFGALTSLPSHASVFPDECLFLRRRQFHGELHGCRTYITWHDMTSRDTSVCSTDLLHYMMPICNMYIHMCIYI